MFSLQRILGKEDKFFDLLEASAEEARISVQALVRFNQGQDRQAMMDDLGPGAAQGQKTQGHHQRRHLQHLRHCHRAGGHRRAGRRAL